MRRTYTLAEMSTPMGERGEITDIPGFPSADDVRAAIAASNTAPRPVEPQPLPADLLADMAPSDWLRRAMARGAR